MLFSVVLSSGGTLAEGTALLCLSVWPLGFTWLALLVLCFLPADSCCFSVGKDSVTNLGPSRCFWMLLIRSYLLALGSMELNSQVEPHPPLPQSTFFSMHNLPNWEGLTWVFQFPWQLPPHCTVFSGGGATECISPIVFNVSSACILQRSPFGAAFFLSFYIRCRLLPGLMFCCPFILIETWHGGLDI